MKNQVRFFLFILILMISISLLIWGYAPNTRETRIQSIAPAEMQLPVP